VAEVDLNRRDAVEDLVLLRRPVTEAANRLRSFPWDSDVEYVVLSDGDVRRVLDAFLDGQLEAHAISAWAEAVEGRDDIGIAEPHEHLLKDFIFDAANPEINGTMTIDKAMRWKATLDS
jgi:hypothetical protein